MKRKTWLVLALVLLLLVALVSCQTKETPADPTEAEKEIADQIAEGNDVDLSVLDDTNEATDQIESTADNGDTAVSAYEMEVAKTLIDRPVSELFDLIGAPNDSSYASSCMGSGDDGELYYDTFTVVTYREGDNETVVDVY